MSIFTKIRDAIFHRAEAAPQPSAPAAPPAPPVQNTAPGVPPVTGTAPAGAAPAPASPAPAAPSASGAAPAAPTSQAPSTSASPTPSAPVDVAAIMDKAVRDSGQHLDWRHSIVDTMKALGLDSSLAERKELAQELGYTGDTGDSAAMNVWLQKALMRKLAENGGQVPAELRD
ncbi:DUF3597 domain-containing protein [Aureimonas sp. AU4]|uniref:DUF3597 domain-containing protein n=1 Tax=Aureimonas sp. AU4 TaxID=1638163 RepID=UPI00078108C2|nr:DUF3597 domain-containing protein [Aureimonas sp. AU4]